MVEKVCRACGGWTKKIFCCEECKLEFQTAKLGTPESRHVCLLRVLDEERVPAVDPLRNLDFYAEIIASGLCTYCNLPLAKSGHALDKIINTLGHRAFNVCPCCPTCNRIKSDDEFSFKEMTTIIGPAVADVHRSRSQSK